MHKGSVTPHPKGTGSQRSPILGFMHCISAVFAVVKSIRLSVTFVYCIQTAEDIVKLLSQPGIHIILFF